MSDILEIIISLVLIILSLLFCLIAVVLNLHKEEIWSCIQERKE